MGAAATAPFALSLSKGCSPAHMASTSSALTVFERIRLSGRVPFRLRVFFRGAFALLAFATVALALTVLVDEKQRSHRRYAEGLQKNLAQIAARLRHPTGQLALLNPELADQAPTPLHPLVLPFSAIDFDDRVKSLQAIEMAGCQVQYPDGSSWCAGVGSNPYAGAFVYLVGSVALGELVSHPSGELDLSGFHRVRVELAMRGQTFRWIAPFEALDDAASGSAGRRGRLTGYIDEDQPIAPGTRPVRDFRGWLWQEGRCLERDANPDICVKRSFVSIRLPIEISATTCSRRSSSGHRPIWRRCDCACSSSPPATARRCSTRTARARPCRSRSANCARCWPAANACKCAGSRPAPDRQPLSSC